MSDLRIFWRVFKRCTPFGKWNALRIASLYLNPLPGIATRLQRLMARLFK